MGPEAEPYRPSWLPFGRARLAASSREIPRGTAGGMGTPVRTRINMAPIQLSRAANQPRLQAPAPVPTRSAAPAVAPPRPLQRPPVHATRSPAPPARTYAETSTPNRATQAPSRTSYVPSSRAAAPALPVGVSTTGRMPGQRPAQQRRVGQRPGWTSTTRPPGTPPFDALAVAAIVMTFIFAPFALVLAISSVKRAYAKRVSPALSWLAVLMSGVGTLMALGLLSSIVQSFQGIGG